MDRLHESQQGKLNQVQETESGYRQELLKQLQEAEVMIKKLEDDKMRLKLEKMAVEVSKARREEQLQLEIDKLNAELKNAHKKYLQHLQEKGELCVNDCVLCCLLWICHEKFGIYPCGRHLEKIITSETQREHGITCREELCCGKFMDMLMKCGIIDHAEIKTYKIPEEIDKAWEELMDIDAKNLVVMVGRVFSKHQGHCVVCDLETRNQENGLLTYHDLQQDESKTGNRNAFRNLVRRDEDIKLFTVNFKKLQEIINKHRDILHITYSKSNIAKPIDSMDTTRVRELVVCADIYAASDNDRSASNEDHTASDEERAASDNYRAVRNDGRTATDDERAASDIDRAVSGDKRAACDNERTANDTHRAVSDAKRAVSSDDRAASNVDLAGSENNRAACGGERVAYDSERAVTDDKRAASSGDRAAKYVDLAGSEDNHTVCYTERAARDAKHAVSAYDERASSDVERAASDVERVSIGSEPATLEQLPSAFTGDDKSP